MSVTLQAGTGRTVKLTISEELHDHFTQIERMFKTFAGDKASFLAFACFSLWRAWMPTIDAYDDKWKHIYERDRHRCTGPVCDRRDSTPHHLHFQGHGGGDEDENVVDGCAWCHLEGIHGGRLTAKPPASSIHWTIGREPIIEVRGRERIELQAV